MKKNFIRITRKEAEYLAVHFPNECTPDEAELYFKLRDFAKNGY